MGDDRLGAIALATTQEDGADQPRDARVDVNDRAACEVQHAGGAQEAAAPDPVADGRIDQQRPQGREQQQTGIFHPLGEGAGDQGRGDDGEGHLEGDEQIFGNAGQQGVRRAQGHAVQEQHVQAAHIGLKRGVRVGAEGDAVAGDEPDQRDHGEDADRLGDGGDDVLAAHHAAVEQGQTRQGHQQDQSGRGAQPGRAGAVQFQHRLVRQQGWRRHGRLGEGPARIEETNGQTQERDGSRKSIPDTRHEQKSPLAISQMRRFYCNRVLRKGLDRKRCNFLATVIEQKLSPA